MWYYLTTNYGRSTVSNLSANPHHAILKKVWNLLLNTPIRQICIRMEGPIITVQIRFRKRAIWWTTGREIKLSNKNQPHHHMQPSHDGKWLLYSVNNAGKSCIKNNGSGRLQMGFPTFKTNSGGRHRISPFCWSDNDREFSLQHSAGIKYIVKYNIQDFKYRAIVAQRGATCLQHRIHR